MIKAILTHIIAIAHSVNVIKVPLVMNVHTGAVDVVDVVDVVAVVFQTNLFLIFAIS